MSTGAGADTSCVEFLRWALPRLELRWAGFRTVRRQVCRRLRQRLDALGLANLDAYRAYLEGPAGRVGRPRGAHADHDLALLPRPRGLP
jgi:hypothetical protein